MIDTFTRTEFEEALPRHKTTGEPLCTHQGVQEGEHTYRMVTATPGVFVTIRSSIGFSGVSAGVGEDSIRAWLVNENGQPLGAKLQKYVTRVPGWQTRLTHVLRTLYGRSRVIKPCPCCQKPTGLYKTANGPNKGRFFLKCQPDDKFLGFVELPTPTKKK